MAAVRLQRATAAEIVRRAGNHIHSLPAARVKVRVIGVAIRVDGHQNALAVGIALKNQLAGLYQYIAVAAPAQRFAGTADI